MNAEATLELIAILSATTTALGTIAGMEAVVVVSMGIAVTATVLLMLREVAEADTPNGRSSAWNISDVVEDAEEYGELREEYVRGELRLAEFEEQVEVEEPDYIGDTL